jgi:3-hydroxyisobutyrate dehydrogenase-like beta-hydroxyacid dehydrogenase
MLSRKPIVRDRASVPADYWVAAAKALSASGLALLKKGICMKATVIGMGMMGKRLAALLLEAGYAVTVWNRSAANAAEAVRKGASLREDVAQAVGASEVTVICVKDYEAANAILNSPGVGAALHGRTVVHLSSGSPQEALDMDAWVRRHGGHYLDGAIQAAPEQMGLPATPVFVSGSKLALDNAQAVLKVFGAASYLGERPSLASAMDFATLSYVYGATIGFFHGARIAETEGLGVDRYGALVNEIAPSFGEFLKHEGNVIHSGNYAITQSPLRISIDATRRIAQHARDNGLHSAVPELSETLFRQAGEAGYADEEAAAVMKVMRAAKG